MGDVFADLRKIKELLLATEHLSADHAKPLIAKALNIIDEWDV